MRARFVIIAAMAAWVAGCSPEIGAGTYYCGPERLCPPDLVCDGPTFICESELVAQPFECAEGAEQYEPDDDLASARDLGTAACGNAVLGEFRGCIAGGDEADSYTYEVASSCSGDDPHFDIRLRFPVAFAPLTLEVLDGDGNVIATGEPCGGSATGTDARCVELEPAVGTWSVRVSIDPAGADCDGDCRFNHYWLDIEYPLA